MKILNKIGLFLSAFVPLFLLLILKEIIEIINQNWTFNFLNTFLLLCLITFSICGIYCLVISIKNLKEHRGKSIIVISKRNTTDQHFLGYFSLFVLFAVSFEIEMYSMAIIFLVVIVLIGIVYIKNDMYFINPLLNILGYSFYEIKYNDGNADVVANAFFKGKLIEGEHYVLCDKYSNLFFIKKQ